MKQYVPCITRLILIFIAALHLAGAMMLRMNGLAPYILSLVTYGILTTVFFGNRYYEILTPTEDGVYNLKYVLVEYIRLTLVCLGTMALVIIVARVVVGPNLFILLSAAISSGVHLMLSLELYVTGF